MEDAHIAEPTLYALQDDTTKIVLPGHSLFAVFDGHGGTYSALYCGNNLLRVLSKQAKFVEYAKFCQDRQSNTPTNAAEKVQYLRNGIDALEQAFRDCFVELDQEIGLAIKGNLHPDYNKPYHSKESKEEEKNKKVEDKSVSDNNNNNNSDDIMAAASRAAANHASALDDDGDSGTTACVVMVTPDWLVCANAGDSRAVFSKSGRSIPLSYDHKPDDEEEERRIRAAGGYVAGGRVEGDLAVSRGLGDFRFKHLPTVLEMQRNEEKGTMNPGDQKVSPIPDVLLQNRSPEDEFLIVACDGIWDVRTNPECVQEVAQMFQEGESDVGLLCEEVRNEKKEESVSIYLFWTSQYTHLANHTLLLFYFLTAFGCMFTTRIQRQYDGIGRSIQGAIHWRRGWCNGETQGAGRTNERRCKPSHGG